MKTFTNWRHLLKAGINRSNPPNSTQRQRAFRYSPKHSHPFSNTLEQIYSKTNPHSLSHTCIHGQLSAKCAAAVGRCNPADNNHREYCRKPSLLRHSRLSEWYFEKGCTWNLRSSSFTQPGARGRERTEKSAPFLGWRGEDQNLKRIFF